LSDYDSAEKSLLKAISLDASYPIYHIWYAYTDYLEADLTIDPRSQRYQEKILSIIL